MRKGRRRAAAPLLAAAAVAGCAPAPHAEPVGNRLVDALAGRVAGEPVECLPFNRSQGTEAVGGNALLFRDGGRIWLSRGEGGGCDELDGGNYTLVTRSTGSRLCSGDIGRVVDLTTGMVAGSCVPGPFVPYTKGDQRP